MCISARMNWRWKTLPAISAADLFPARLADVSQGGTDVSPERPMDVFPEELHFVLLKMA